MVTKYGNQTRTPRIAGSSHQTCRVGRMIQEVIVRFPLRKHAARPLMTIAAPTSPRLLACNLAPRQEIFMARN
jgi:hypothetical protein